MAADKTHRGHAIIEQVHADLKNSALAHLPSGRFTANAAWLVLAVMAFNLTRAAACLTGPQLAKATTGTIRRTLITVPARIATSARRLMLHLPLSWPWQHAWTALFNRACGPPALVGHLTTQPDRRDQEPTWNTPDSEVRRNDLALTTSTGTNWPRKINSPRALGGSGLRQTRERRGALWPPSSWLRSGFVASRRRAGWPRLPQPGRGGRWR